MDLEDPVHRIIYDKNLPYEPCKIFTTLPIVLPKQSELKTVPPKVAKRELLKGYNAENVHNSLFWSIMSIYAVYGCKLPDSVNDLRKLAMNEIKKGILGIKLKDQSFNNHHGNYRTFLQDFESGVHT